MRTLYKTEKKTHWSLQKNVPSNILASRAESARREGIKEIIETFKNKKKGKVVTYALCRKTPMGFFIVGGGSPYFEKFEQAKEFARGMGRDFIKMGAIKARLN